MGVCSQSEIQQNKEFCAVCNPQHHWPGTQCAGHVVGVEFLHWHYMIVKIGATALVMVWNLSQEKGTGMI